MNEPSLLPSQSKRERVERSGNLLISKTLFKKASSSLVVLMLLSMLVPVLASAAMIFNGTFNSGGTVTGQVYFDGDVGDAVYGEQSVDLAVYSKNGQFIQNITVTFDTYQGGKSYYNINTDIPSVYDAVYFGYADGSVTENVYRKPAPPTGCTFCGGGGGGGGGSSISGDTVESSNGTVNANDLKNALEKYTTVTIKVSGDHVAIPVSALLNAKEGSILKVVTEQGAYLLPLDAFDFEALAKSVESTVNDLLLNVDIKKLSGADATAVENAISALGAKSIADAVDFGLSVEGKVNGKKASIDSFDRYVKRLIPLTSKAEGSATVVLYNPDSKTLSFVPNSITETEAEFWRTGNSIYTVIGFSKTFNDIKSHWGQAYIEQLAGKLIIDGMTDTTFEPDRNITRAEFAALVVRSLGLSTITDKAYFGDVSSDSWYAGVINAAAKAGLVDGYEDGTFRPNTQITREELAAMIVRAYKYAGGEISLGASEQTEILTKWFDANRIVWGQKEVAQAIKAGLMDGMTNTTLETYGQATRSQTAAMLQRFLTGVKFIN
ncbi:S-layer homology domain-containing protein [Paenibacillus ginsengarvi]|uniref:S-layer homology domain-containing protein n=1 Tax=Paenibacillus ginsengarvi TaxID=400777 RepID=A0A3B0C8D1_9BACL|nr:S-layer homology domain-containing protein [Paenibacillus ginsengarvi]RKN82193.1 S-layer homology domain-containing protein [Paenibacillus ginsengarvi]